MTLEILRDAEFMAEAERFTCLRTAGTERRIPPRVKVAVPVAAHPGALTRIGIDRTVLLVEAAIGAELRIGDNPCFFWELVSSEAEVDPWSAAPPLAACAAEETDCPDGYHRVGSPGPIDDPVCGDSRLRCVAGAVVTLLDGTQLSIAPQSCGFPTVEIGGTTVLLAAGVGSRWALSLGADGRIGGTFTRPR